MPHASREGTFSGNHLPRHSSESWNPSSTLPAYIPSSPVPSPVPLSPIPSSRRRPGSRPVPSPSFLPSDASGSMQARCTRHMDSRRRGNTPSRGLRYLNLSTSSRCMKQRESACPNGDKQMRKGSRSIETATHDGDVGHFTTKSTYLLPLSAHARRTAPAVATGRAPQRRRPGRNRPVHRSPIRLLQPDRGAVERSSS